ncbi:hypothetical protein OpiT1DRAFT_05637 [Opitutaceae bacterium TAV1]|nr:hypothetical protein OpiT1DRAFT_05637 [Opitutaceae bacterium TAV1]
MHKTATLHLVALLLLLALFGVAGAFDCPL